MVVQLTRSRASVPFHASASCIRRDGSKRDHRRKECQHERRGPHGGQCIPRTTVGGVADWELIFRFVWLQQSTYGFALIPIDQAQIRLAKMGSPRKVACESWRSTWSWSHGAMYTICMIAAFEAASWRRLPPAALFESRLEDILRFLGKKT